jgi:hypothetical protein
MTKTAAQLDAEIAEALAKRPRAGVSVRKIGAADPHTWTMRHAPGSRASAAYGVFVGNQQVATINGETKGYRGITDWKVETLGDWLGPPAQRPKRLYSATSFKAARDWAVANIETAGTK